MNLNKALSDIADLFQRIQILDTPDIRATRTGAGIQLRLVNPLAVGGGSGTSSSICAYPCLITGVSGDGYSVQVYDAVGGTLLGTSTILAPLLMFGETLPTGVWITANIVGLAAIGDGDGV